MKDKKKKKEIFIDIYVYSIRILCVINFVNNGIMKDKKREQKFRLSISLLLT